MAAILYDSIEAMGNDHYDVGLVGVWYGENYGSTLTYFALQKAIRDMGYSVLMLEKPAPADDPELNWGIHSRIFAKEHYQAVAPRLLLPELPQLNAFCDKFVVGSDQLWNYGISKWFGKSFFLDFANDDKLKVSYGTSFGHAKSFTPMEHLSDTTRYLNRFDAVGVREDTAVRVLYDEFGIEGCQVLDPVFLMDSKIYEEIAGDNSPVTNDYLLAYVLDPSPELGAALKKLAKQKGLELVVLSDARGTAKQGNDLEGSKALLGIKDVHLCPDAVTWLRYIKNASYVVTDSFHGACFTLIFGRQLIVLANKERGAERMQSLANQFSLWDVVAFNAAELDDIIDRDSRVDYNFFTSVLEHEKAFSRDWLQKALRTDKRMAEDITCVTKKECCGCGACFNACPFEAIQMVSDSEGFLYPHIDREACRSCGRCKKVCPSLNPHYEKWKVPAMFAGYTKDEIREQSSSGGVFSLVARRVLANGGVVCGAAFDDAFHLKHVVISTEEDLGPLRMSKYMQSDTQKTYTEIKKALDDNREALFVGCPCQVAGLNSFLGKNYPKLITIDLLCHGGPSQKIFQKYLAEVHGGHEIAHVGFRDKDFFGWSHEMTVRYKDGKTVRSRYGQDVYYRAFDKAWSVRPHCQVCNYARLPRQGDLTLGDFWGVARYSEEYTDGRGTSIISVNSSKGLHVLSDLEEDLDVLGGINLQYVLEHGQPFAKPFNNTPLRNRFHRLAEDASLEKAVECCAQNIFDVGIVGVKAESPFDILDSYAIYKLVAREGCSALVVRHPLDLLDKYQRYGRRLVQFGNRYYPRISDHVISKKQGLLNKTCDGLVALPGVGREVLWFARKGVVDCKQLLSSNPLLLLKGDDYRRLSRGVSAPIGATHGVYLSESSQLSTSLSATFAKHDIQPVDLTADMEIEKLIAVIDMLEMVVTDNEDCMALCMRLGTPALYMGNSTAVPPELILKEGDRIEDVLDRISQMDMSGFIDEDAIQSQQKKLLEAIKICIASVPDSRSAQTKHDKPKVKHSPASGSVPLLKKGIRYAKRYGVGAAFKKGIKKLKGKVNGS